MHLGDAPLEPWPAIPTGIMSLDYALGIGGLPKGRMIEIYGPESSGKSTVGLSVIAEAQKTQDKPCLFVDTEHALDPTYADALGIDLDELYITQPDYAEQALEIVDSFVRTGSVSVIVVDSVAALTPKVELEGEMGQAHVGLQSRLMSQAMRKLAGNVSKTDTIVIFINQIREKVGVMFGNPEVTPGGRALKFYSSVRISLRKKDNIKDKADGSMAGVVTEATLVKNKIAPPLRKARFDIVYGKGVNNVGCVVDYAIDYGIVKKSGAWLSYNGESVAQGRDNLVTYLEDEPELLKEIGWKVDEALHPLMNIDGETGEITKVDPSETKDKE